MNDYKLNNLKIEVEKLVLSEIQVKTGLILSEDEFRVDLKKIEEEISGDVFLFDEYYENFRIKNSKGFLKERISKMVFTVFSEFGELEGIITSGKRYKIETQLEETTNNILNSINLSKSKLQNLGKVTIMVDEVYPYGQTYENNFPLLQYDIRDSNKILNLSFNLDCELNAFDKQKIIIDVQKEIELITNKNTGHNKR